MNSIQVNGLTYWLPASESDVITLVEDAKTNNEIICVRGSAHSFPIIKSFEHSPVSSSGRNYKYIMLSNMNTVSIDAANMQVTVQAGCHLGEDPWDPTGLGTTENSLLYKLDQAGLAMSDLGGITHQTVGGFLSTSSSGGSTQFAFDEALLSIDIIHYDATLGVAKKVTFQQPSPANLNDPFYALGVASMGLFGIIVSATFQCCTKFYIAGAEITSPTTPPVAPSWDPSTCSNGCFIDLFGPGVPANGNTPAIPSLQDFFEQKQTAPFPSDTTHFPYSRFLWWPQSGVNKVVVWKARQTDQAGATSWASNNGTLKTYQEVPWIFNSPIPATIGADLMFSAIGTWPNWLLDVMGDTPDYHIAKGLIETSFMPIIFPFILNTIFLTNGIQKFADDGYTGLPMDNQMSDNLFPVWFTELWIPINQTQSVMNDLKNYYAGGCKNTGAFSVEIYAAKSSPFWLSPAYNTDVIRIDVFWFGNDEANPSTFYQNFWTLLAKYNYRPHWAKYLPDSTSNQGVSYLKSLYPKWDDWMNLREQMDHYQLFVNDYWRDHLGIPQPQ